MRSVLLALVLTGCSGGGGSSDGGYVDAGYPICDGGPPAGVICSANHPPGVRCGTDGFEQVCSSSCATRKPDFCKADGGANGWVNWDGDCATAPGC